MTLGQVHTIALQEVLYVDVGKSTAVLQLLDIHDDFCFSLLTNGGSLDLQASNKLERDALISCCLCLILDTVYNHLLPEQSWRWLNYGVKSEGSSSGNSGSSSDVMNKFDGNEENKALEKGANSNVIQYSSSSSSAPSSIIGSDVFHGIDLGSQISAMFGEI